MLLCCRGPGMAAYSSSWSSTAATPLCSPPWHAPRRANATSRQLCGRSSMSAGSSWRLRPVRERRPRSHITRAWQALLGPWHRRSSSRRAPATRSGEPRAMRSRTAIPSSTAKSRPCWQSFRCLPVSKPHTFTGAAMSFPMSLASRRRQVPRAPPWGAPPRTAQIAVPRSWLARPWASGRFGRLWTWFGGAPQFAEWEPRWTTPSTAASWWSC
mmetsp:Transcript_2834/g.5983  ORF Transcript_2834/g.5983 Transcript_2834/m.5983 type:complete len:213 (+) Transcript_2834:330-968(+)